MPAKITRCALLLPNTCSSICSADMKYENNACRWRRYFPFSGNFINQPRTRFLCSCAGNASKDHEVHLLTYQHLQLNMQSTDEELVILIKMTLAAGNVICHFHRSLHKSNED
ncbi:3-ketoacyl-CoA synthase [Psidium guajava]|nr:3-ketoacyl-CoA synthase [Psidium guajava]